MKQKALSKPTVRRGSEVSSTVEKSNEPVKGGERSSQYLQAIVDSFEDELMVIDRDFHIIDANEVVLLRHGKYRYSCGMWLGVWGGG
jgi:hypothetical protein